MAKRHYIPITSDVPGVSDSKCAFIRKVIRTALAAEGVDFPCEIDVRLTDDETIHEINREMREVDRATDVLSFPMFELTPGELPGEEDADPGTGRARRRAGEGIRPLQPPRAGVPRDALGASPSGLRPSGRRADESADAGT